MRNTEHRLACKQQVTLLLHMHSSGHMHGYSVVYIGMRLWHMGPNGLPGPCQLRVTSQRACGAHAR